MKVFENLTSYIYKLEIFDAKKNESLSSLLIKFVIVFLYLYIFAVFPSNSGIAISGAVAGYVIGI